MYQIYWKYKNGEEKTEFCSSYQTVEAIVNRLEKEGLDNNSSPPFSKSDIVNSSVIELKLDKE